jgi:hypothetical protein
VPVNAENTFLLFKERRPFKLKKECPSEQWEVISFRLIPLKTPVSFRWTVPLRESKNRISVLFKYKTRLSIFSYSSLSYFLVHRKSRICRGSTMWLASFHLDISRYTHSTGIQYKGYHIISMIWPLVRSWECAIDAPDRSWQCMGFMGDGFLS